MGDWAGQLSESGRESLTATLKVLHLTSGGHGETPKAWEQTLHGGSHTDGSNEGAQRKRGAAAKTRVAGSRGRRASAKEGRVDGGRGQGPCFINQPSLPEGGSALLNEPQKLAALISNTRCLAAW